MKEVEKMRNSKYTKEFRDETVQLILNSEKSAMQIGKDLGINDKTIYNWIKVYKKENNITTPIDEAKNQSKCWSIWNTCNYSFRYNRLPDNKETPYHELPLVRRLAAVALTKCRGKVKHKRLNDLSGVFSYQDESVTV